jgi:polysaccharide export outer membrane protein
MPNIRLFFLPAIILGLIVAFCGCEKDILDPTQIGRFRPTPVVNIILDSLGVAEEEEPKFVESEEPKPVDLLELEQDYILSVGDFVNVYIFELLQETVPFNQIFEISESGNISIPEVGNIQATGLSVAQLEEELKQILSPTILKNPSITVKLESSPSRTFTILGEGLPRPGRYELPGYTLRLADALAQAGSPRQFNVSNIYITRYENRQALDSRQTPPQTPSYAPPVQPEINLTPIEPQNKNKDNSEELLEIIAPHTSKNTTPSSANGNIVISASESTSYKELKSLAMPDGLEMEEDDLLDAPNMLDTNLDPNANKPAKEVRTEWIFKDGKWVAEEIEDPFAIDANDVSIREKLAQTPKKQGSAMNLPEVISDDQTRVIRVPVKRLGVDPRYNIVIRPGDIITVPFNVVGEAVVMGNVNNPGYVDLTGRPMTLIQAVAAAGGLSALAEPSRVEVRRRVGENSEQIVSVDLDKIARGLQPDFFIKENDTINVGTLPTSRFAAVLRNAFRATYGFGFIYDRNFADRDFGTSRPIPSIF